MRLRSSRRQPAQGIVVGGPVEFLAGHVGRLLVTEDDIRLWEREQKFGPRFVELARWVYRTNDRRTALKRAINELLGSRLVEEKSYSSYGSGEPGASAPVEVERGGSGKMASSSGRLTNCRSRWPRSSS